MNFTAIRLLILDVDGVLTDGRVTASRGGEDAKAFHVQDGCAIKVWQQHAGLVAVLSGRESSEVKRRAEELGIAWLRMGIDDKLLGFEELLQSAEVPASAVAYVGDDLPDLGPMRRSAWPVAVANAVPTVKRAAQYVTRRRGGEGAVAETIELLLRKQRRWSAQGAATI